MKNKKEHYREQWWAKVAMNDEAEYKKGEIVEVSSLRRTLLMTGMKGRKVIKCNIDFEI